MSEQPSILIADDHPLFRQAVLQVLAERFPEWEVSAAADIAGLQQLLDHCARPELLLLDLHIPGAVGLSALSWLQGQYPALPVIMLSANTHPETVRRAIDHGAAAFLSKSAEVDSMVDCLQRVRSGERGLHPGLAISAAATALDALDVADALAALTPQQFRVLNMLAEGLLNKQIAHLLAVKEATIKAHVTEILRKLGVNSRTQAVLALNRLLITPPEAISRPP